MRRRDGTPVWIARSPSKTHALRRVDLNKGAAGAKYDEAWLQRLLQENPDILPVDQIEPGFGALIPVCRELCLSLGGGKFGMLDNLFVTAEGGLFLVETKLWRNPEARRAVVAQAMEYAAAVFRLNYAELEAAALQARSVGSVAGQTEKSLFKIVANQTAGIDEAEFIDAVSRNLRRGRAIVAVAGDGIREDITAIANMLQSHAGLRFIFALIELGIYETPHADVRVVIPSVLAQTALIERGVVQIDDAAEGSTKKIVVREAATSTGSKKAYGIGEDEFYELLDQAIPGASTPLKSFLEKAESLGFYVDRQGGLNLKRNVPNGNALNVASIMKDGRVDTFLSSYWKRHEIGNHYNLALAGRIGGKVSKSKTGETSLRTAAGRLPFVTDLLPAHEEAWLKAIEDYVREYSSTAEPG